MPSIKPIHYKKLAKVFESQGFIHSRTKGDHMIYSKPGIIRPIIIPMYKEIPEFIILKNLKTAGISKNEYVKLLEKM